MCFFWKHLSSCRCRTQACLRTPAPYITQFQYFLLFTLPPPSTKPVCHFYRTNRHRPRGLTWAGRAACCSPGEAAAVDGRWRTSSGPPPPASACSDRSPRPPAPLGDTARGRRERRPDVYSRTKELWHRVHTCRFQLEDNIHMAVGPFCSFPKSTLNKCLLGQQSKHILFLLNPYPQSIL